MNEIESKLSQIEFGFFQIAHLYKANAGKLATAANKPF